MKANSLKVKPNQYDNPYLIEDSVWQNGVMIKPAVYAPHPGDMTRFFPPDEPTTKPLSNLDLEYDLSLVNNCEDVIPKQVKISWGELIECFENPAETNDKDSTAIIFSKFKYINGTTYRSSDYVQHITMLSLDIEAPKC